MSWRDLITDVESVALPWVGGRTLRNCSRTWTIDGTLPTEHDWYLFNVAGRKAAWQEVAEPQVELLHHVVKGYLVGDRIVPDDARVDPDPSRIGSSSERVHLLEPGLDRFVRVAAGRVYEGGPFVYRNQEMPLGSEEEVLQAFLDSKASVDGIKGVVPALDAAFRMETWQRAEAERRRVELERLRREEEERRAREERERLAREVRETRRREVMQRLGDSVGRREMARVDFTEAARAALAVGGAELLDARPHVNRGEHAVRYRLMGRRFECICDEAMRILDAGICLTDERTHVRGDTRFTLESLPSVVLEADREGKLVVFRHV